MENWNNINGKPQVEEEIIYAITGNYLDKLRLLYDSGVLKPGQDVEVTHEEECSAHTDKPVKVCDCNVKISLNGRNIEFKS